MREYLIPRGNPCTKFGNSQAKGSKDIGHTALSLQTHQLTNWYNKQQVQNNMSPPFQGAYLTISHKNAA